MVDFAGNPYLTDPRFQLSDDQMRQYRLGSLGSALTNFGAGIAASGASGQPWMAGIAPGAAMASQALGQEQSRLAQMQDAAAKWAQMEDYRKAQEKELGLKTSQLEMDQELQRRFLGGGGLDQFKAPQGPMMGPSVAPPASGPPVDLQKVGPPVVNYLMSQHGLSAPAAAGVAGNLFQESGFNPNAVGDGGKSKGIAQWDPDRYAGLQKFAAASGGSAADPKTQLDYMMSEMKGGDMGAQRAYAQLQQAKTPQEAATAMLHFERPQGYTPNNPQGANGYANRVQYAQALMPNGQPVPQGGDAVAGQPGAMPQPPQNAPQMPPGMPGPPPDNSGMAPYMMSPRLAPIVNFGVGQQGKQYEYQWKAYQAQQEAAKLAQDRANAGVQIGADGQPILNPMVPQAKALEAGAVERSKLAPDITQGQARAAGEKAAAEETAKAKAYNDIYFPQTDSPGWEKMSPQDRLKTLPPNVRGVVEDMSPAGGLALSDLPARMASAGLDPSKMDVYSLAKKVYGSEFDMRQNENQKNLLTNVYEANKPEGATRLALITGTQHLDMFAQLVKAQANGNIPAINDIIKRANDAAGSNRFSSAEALMQFLAPEAAKVVKGGGALNEKEVEDNKRVLMTTRSWPQASAILQTWEGAMLARKNGLDESLRSTGVPEAKIDRIWGVGPDGQPSSMAKAIKSLHEVTAAPQKETAGPVSQPQMLNDAKNAIMRGAPRDKVIERLKSQGIDPAGL